MDSQLCGCLLLLLLLFVQGPGHMPQMHYNL
jgi:hypothetical protein